MSDVAKAGDTKSTVPTTAREGSAADEPDVPSYQVTSQFQRAMLSDDGSTVNDPDSDEFADEIDQDLFQSLGDSEKNRKSRDRDDASNRFYRHIDFFDLPEYVEANDAGLRLRISMSQRGLNRKTFEQHAAYAGRLGAHGCADYINALTGTHCSELGLYAVAFAYSEQPMIDLDHPDDLRILEKAMFDRFVDSHLVRAQGRPLPNLEKFSAVVASASTYHGIHDQTLEELVTAFAKLPPDSPVENAAMRLFEVGEFSPRVLAPLIDQVMTSRHGQTVNHNEKFRATDIVIEAANRFPPTAIGVLASPLLSDENIAKMFRTRSQDTDKLLGYAISTEDHSDTGKTDLAPRDSGSEPVGPPAEERVREILQNVVGQFR